MLLSLEDEELQGGMILREGGTIGGEKRSYSGAGKSGIAEIMS